jgi:hypothetical protein
MYESIVQFHAAIIFHEDTLMDLPMNKSENLAREDYSEHRKRFQRSDASARANLVGASPTMEPPKFPKDDSTVSKKEMPESKGARPCRHCGSGKHWDNECRNSFRANKFARANLATASADDERAQEEYDELYYNLGDEQDFDIPLQSTGASSFQVNADLKTGGSIIPALKGQGQGKANHHPRKRRA